MYMFGDKQEEKEMRTIIENKDVKSTEITFQTNEELKAFESLLNNPKEPNERVKRLMKSYKNELDRER